MTVIALLNVLGEIRAHILHNLLSDGLLIVLRGYKLFIESILLISDCIDSIEVVHVADGAGASPGQLHDNLILMHG